MISEPQKTEGRFDQKKAKNVQAWTVRHQRVKGSSYANHCKNVKVISYTGDSILFSRCACEYFGRKMVDF